MSQPANSTRALVMERRKAMSSGGKAALMKTGVTPANTSAPAPTQTAPAPVSAPGVGAREASLARRKAMSSQGKAGITTSDRTRTSADQKSVAASTPAGNTSVAKPAVKARIANRPAQAANAGKAAALARRKALSSKGKAALSSKPMTVAESSRAKNPEVNGRDLAKAVREQKSKVGGAIQNSSGPSGRQRPGAAQDASWKVGASETNEGQTITGSMVGRQANMTGDEPSTCRTITGTEYLGADVFQEFCKSSGEASTAKKVTVTTTSHGNPVSGNRMGRSSNVTGNEPGSCSRVTGANYVSSEQLDTFCNGSANSSSRKNMSSVMTGTRVGRSARVTGDEHGMKLNLTGTRYTGATDIGFAPSKVGTSTTYRGGKVTGTMVERGVRMTGNEAGSCKAVTGIEYLGQETYNGFCKAVPQPGGAKVKESRTMASLKISGNLTERSQNVTGNEPGSCKSVTGTPYNGMPQYDNYCDEADKHEAEARMAPSGRTYGKPMTGLQPGITDLTGAQKGACSNVSGTPYVGADQAAEACSASDPDFPQALTQYGGNFSIQTPASANNDRSSAITGSFGKAEGKITGTQDAHFSSTPTGTGSIRPPQKIDGRVKSRITGEGIDTGLKITGDDWDRGNHVTGTEGTSAAKRNPTRRSGMTSVMSSRPAMDRSSDAPTPVSKVTGSSGNTDKGSLITYSGGARG